LGSSFTLSALVQLVLVGAMRAVAAAWRTVACAWFEVTVAPCGSLAVAVAWFVTEPVEVPFTSSRSRCS
jgi:hypothetical protein